MAKVDGVSDEADKVDEVSKVNKPKRSGGAKRAGNASKAGKVAPGAEKVDAADDSDVTADAASGESDAVKDSDASADAGVAAGVEDDADSVEDEQADETDPDDEDDEDEDDEDDEDEAAVVRSPETAAFWAEMRVDPVEIALPRGVGFTLRAYRPSNEITLSEIDREEDDFTILDRQAAGDLDDEDLDDEFEADEDDLDDEDLDEDGKADDEDDESGEDDEDLDEDEVDAKLEAIGSGEIKADDEDHDDEDEETEDVPVFLGKAGKLYLFRSPEALVEYVRSETDHDLAQLETWQQIQERITVEDVVADDADRYELDLIVDNLRGTKEVWEAELLIKAGEIARDLGYALRIRQVLSALSPGSPLDDLDELLRASTAGGLGGFFARRKLKKIGAQQASLGWRTIIGKISAAVDWRE